MDGLNNHSNRIKIMYLDAYEWVALTGLIQRSIINEGALLLLHPSAYDDRRMRK